ncbi:biotin transporter BioY [Agromyces laixinhei]|uniref:biotin transporter BioY n=1 Tax=Agromyces laixinhei TaxID=2585717 RepID=UPI0012EEC43B|nr:biotin transporter BioY [Agromyces laixinhei]
MSSARSTTPRDSETGDVTAAPRRSTARDLAQIAVFAALIAALTLPGQIPLGFGVPITLQTLGVMLAGAILGARRGTLAVTVYVALGLAGLPILAGGAAGLGILAGPTGGFLVGFIPGAFVIGWLVERFAPKPPFWAIAAASLVGGVLVVYLVGIPWFAVVTGMPVGAAIGVMSPFLIGDVAKAVVTAAVATGVHRAWPGLLTPRAWPWQRREDSPAA